jgi:hypothetical protein
VAFLSNQKIDASIFRRSDKAIVWGQAAALVKKVAKAKNLLLVVDNPEEIVGTGLNDVTPENAVRLGTFLSALHLLNAEGVRVVCFLKEQIVQAVRSNYPDFSHFADQLDGLSWTSEDLRALLSNRVTNRLSSKWQDVFDFKQEEITDIFRFLSNGPRDLLQLCNLAGNAPGKISKEALLAGVPVVRSDRLKDLSAQYKQWPSFLQFTREMLDQLDKQHKGNDIPVGDINSIFAQQYSKPKTPIHALRAVDWVDKARWEAPLVDERLFVAGILGYSKGRSKVYPWNGRDTSGFQQADAHFVSPLYA